VDLTNTAALEKRAAMKCHVTLPEVLACPSAPAAITPVTKSVSTEFVVSQESLDAMVANPSAAVTGLTNGIAEGLGVQSSAVEITRTVPDLLSGRRLAVERRLSDATLTVEFDVTVANAAAAANVESLASGDSTVVASVTSEVESGLAAQSIQVTIVSVAASEVVTTDSPAATVAATTVAGTTAATTVEPTLQPAEDISGVKPVAVFTSLMLVLFSAMQ
jgi:hypothetical protein